MLHVSVWSLMSSQSTHNCDFLINYPILKIFFKKCALCECYKIPYSVLWAPQWAVTLNRFYNKMFFFFFFSTNLKPNNELFKTFWQLLFRKTFKPNSFQLYKTLNFNTNLFFYIYLQLISYWRIFEYRFLQILFIVTCNNTYTLNNNWAKYYFSDL